MNILLIYVPSRTGFSKMNLPLGLLYVAGIIERCGHKAIILDLYLHSDGDVSKSEMISNYIEEHKPSVIGYGGIATSYGMTKRLSHYVRERYPDIQQVAGGPLSSTYELLLTHTNIDVVFHGETEISLPIFINHFDKKVTIYDTPGISYVCDGKIVKNPLPNQIADIDTIPLPAYHAIDINRYLDPIEQWLGHYEKMLGANPYYQEILRTIGSKKYITQMITSRGCTHHCSFCYRHVRGVRQNSVKYIIEHMKYLISNYHIDGFQFSDELFNSSLEWVLEFCDAIEENGLDIIYFVAGARIDKMNEQVLRRLKETGCIEVNYGHESGSDIILKEYKKGVSRKQNYEITCLTRKVGMLCPVQIVIGSPGETNETIKETIQFLKDVDAYQYSINYLIPLPETPIWKYVKQQDLIQDVEKYLGEVASLGGGPLVNLTKVPEKVWTNWATLIHFELRLYYYYKVHRKKYYLFKSTHRFLERIWRLVPRQIQGLVPSRLRKFY